GGVVGRHRRPVGAGRVGEAGARVGVDVVLFDAPGGVLVLLPDDVGDLVVGALAEELPGAADGAATGEQTAQQPVAPLPQLARSAQSGHGAPSSSVARHVRTAYPVSTVKSAGLEERGRVSSSEPSFPAAHGAQRSKRWPRALTALRSVRGSERRR